MSTVDDMLYHLGGVPVGGGLLPPMGGSGRVYFVDPANGSDGNTGDTPGDAKDTVGAAEDVCTDKAGDTIYLLNDGNTTGTSRESTVPLVWDKDNTHLIGLCAPSWFSQRSRITPASGATIQSEPFMTVSGHGNYFKNLQIAHWGDTDTIDASGVNVEGNRNVFENCHIVGIGGANVGDQAAAVDLQIDGEENVFINCVIGTDTVARSAANSNVKFGGGAAEEAARNLFINCIFPMWADAGTPYFINAAAATDTQRFQMFRGCSFINTGTSTLTTGVNWSGNGICALYNCGFYGCTDVTAADSTSVVLVGPAGSPNVDVGLYKGVDIA
jgi:hypothetical protein